ncbi:hypothetical protein LCGC14_1340350 [marine sediment metagenome]|uniref:Uncharacterized protein n=1 Tax=marine sediment metagenome TaxID=412755 RepID=A0A0F9KDQ1_9ZZZZ
MPENNAPRTTTVDLPADMTAAKAKKIIEAYEKKQKTQYAAGKAKREAVQALVKRHQGDYDKLLDAAKRKHGVPAS